MRGGRSAAARPKQGPAQASDGPPEHLEVRARGSRRSLQASDEWDDTHPSLLALGAKEHQPGQRTQRRRAQGEEASPLQAVLSPLLSAPEGLAKVRARALMCALKRRPGLPEWPLSRSTPRPDPLGAC